MVRVGGARNIDPLFVDGILRQYGPNTCPGRKRWSKQLRIVRLAPSAALLHAVNGGGQNQVRAILTGALVGAQVGLSGIPQRFLDGLEDCATLSGLAAELGVQA